MAFSTLLSPLSLYSQSKKDSTFHYYKLILNPKTSEDLPKAINFYTKKKEVDNKRKDTLNLLNDLRMIAIAEYKIGNIYDSEEAAVEALAIVERSSKLDTLIQTRKAILNQLGQVYRMNKNYEKALEVYNNVLKLNPSHNEKIIIINNKGNIYKDQHKYKEALKQYRLLLNNKNHINDSLQYAQVLDNMGYVQSKLGNPEALPNLTKALQIRESFNEFDKTYSSYKNLALYYIDRKNKDEALKFANKAYNLANTLNSITYLQDALSLFAIMDEDPKIVEFKKITDSISKEKQLAENKNAFIKYNVEKEQKNTALAQLQQEKERSQKFLYMSLVIFATVLAAIAIMLLRVRHKKEKIRQVYNTEARISKKVHDEVANDLYHIMVKIQSNNLKKEEVLDDIENIYNKTRDISKENSAVEVSTNFEVQLSDLLLSYKNDQTTVITKNISKMNWKTVSDIKKITVYRVLKELMTNMSKHSQASLVALSFTQIDNKITISYSDNGIGCNIKNKNGLQNAENRIQTLNGTIKFESKPQEGFKAKITL